ncbi:MAG: aspartate kinase [Ktedonobacterales bacterium]|nr:aspartate kinase [Ktedonobacterales bacterium]
MLVIKFGGTSVAQAARLRAAAEIVAGHVRGGATVTVVVSAMAGVTNALLAVADGVLADTSDWRDQLRLVVDRHATTYAELATDPPLRFAVLCAQMEADAATLRLFRATDVARQRLEAARFSGWGERLIVDLFATAAREMGLTAQAFDEAPILLRDGTPTEVPEPSVLATRALLVPRVMPLMYRGGVPVLPGYIALDGLGQPTTLGRNGSDYSAAIIAAALGAEALYIYSDVPGIYTADPKLHPEAALLPQLSYAEVRAIAATGAKVVHPRTVEPLARWHIPLHLRSSFAPTAPGTDVVPLAEPTFESVS